MTTLGQATGRWKSRPVLVGAGRGVVATLVMSAVMIAGVVSGVSPMPKPIPVALVGRTLGPVPVPVAMALGLIAHLSYGAIAGAVLAGLFSRVTVWTGLGYGVLLWVLMGLIWLPFLGWGLFGTANEPRIAVATLLLHLVYGAILGLLLQRSRKVPE